jgi:small subunit ribosomal protein S21
MTKKRTQMSNREEWKLAGSTVYVKNDDVNRALKKLKNKIEEGGKLKDLQKKEYYEKPTTTRRKDKAAGRQRFVKKLEKQQLPKKLY